MTKIKFATTAALAALALASAGVIAAGGGASRDAQGRHEAEGRGRGRSREKPAPEKPLETVEIKGRVVAPDGKPVAGAARDGGLHHADTVPGPGRPAARRPVLDPPAQARSATPGRRFPGPVPLARRVGPGLRRRLVRAGLMRPIGPPNRW